MQKLFALLFIILLALSALTAYLLLTEKIASGEQQIIAGQKQLAKGQVTLDQGKARLANGKRKLSSAKSEYQAVDDNPVMSILDKLPFPGVLMSAASKQIAEGDGMVARGEVNVKVGEGRIATGKLALRRGENRLSRDNLIRIGCAVGAAFLGLLAIALGFYWR